MTCAGGRRDEPIVLLEDAGDGLVVPAAADRPLAGAAGDAGHLVPSGPASGRQQLPSPLRAGDPPLFSLVAGDGPQGGAHRRRAGAALHLRGLPGPVGAGPLHPGLVPSPRGPAGGGGGLAAAGDGGGAPGQDRGAGPLCLGALPAADGAPALPGGAAAPLRGLLLWRLSAGAGGHGADDHLFRRAHRPHFLAQVRDHCGGGAAAGGPGVLGAAADAGVKAFF